MKNLNTGFKQNICTKKFGHKIKLKYKKKGIELKF